MMRILGLTLLRYRHAAVLSAGMLFVLPFPLFAQDTDPIPGLELPTFDVSIAIDVPDTPTDPTPFEGPGADFSFSVESELFDVEVEVQLVTGDPIPDVDVTLKSKPGNPPPPPPPPPPDEGGFCLFGVIIC